MTIDQYACHLPPQRQAAAIHPAPDHDYTHLQGFQIHTLRRANPHAPYRMIVIHGAGGHAEALWPIAAQIPTGLVDLTAVDLPLYGQTAVNDRRAVRYQDWVRVLVEYVSVTDDGRPIVLFGLSIGGLLALEVAHLHGGVQAVVATCLADPRRMLTRLSISRWGCAAYLSPFLPLSSAPGVQSLMLPMRLLADMGKMSRDPALTELCTSDPRGGATRVPLGFLASLLTYEHRVLTGEAPQRDSTSAPEEAPGPRVLLVHPAMDTWTPPRLSIDTLQRCGLRWAYSALPECGHFPIEEPGLTRMIQAITRFIDDPEHPRP